MSCTEFRASLHDAWSYYLGQALDLSVWRLWLYTFTTVGQRGPSMVRENFQMWASERFNVTVSAEHGVSVATSQLFVLFGGLLALPRTDKLNSNMIVIEEDLCMRPGSSIGE